MKTRQTKRGFTLIELIFSIIILGIIGMIGAEIVARVFERYAATRDMERAQSDLRRTLDILAARLNHRVKNSTVAYDIDGGAGVVPVYQPTGGTGGWNLEDYEALEWLGIAYESRRGGDSGGAVVPGWSGIGFRLTPAPSAGAAPAGGWDLFTSPLSNFGIAEDIEETLTGAAADPFGYMTAAANPYTILVFAGKDWRGDTPAGDVSGGYSRGFKYKSWKWLPADTTHNAYSYFKIAPSASNDGNITITPLTPTGLEAYHPPSYSDPNNIGSYYLVRSAYAVWVEDGNLMMAYNFRPWLGDTYTTLNGGGGATQQAILLTDVTRFRFQESGDVLRLVLCVKASEWAAMGPNDDNSTQFCRERTVL
jgi:prepilin-type N-terminal cleavage/methylation domain-containing protein